MTREIVKEKEIARYRPEESDGTASKNTFISQNCRYFGLPEALVKFSKFLLTQQQSKQYVKREFVREIDNND